MASSTKKSPSSPAPTSQPQPVVPPPQEDPLFIHTILHLEAMDEMQMSRAAGQILYDLAIQDPTINLASPEILGMILKTTIKTDEGKVNPAHYPLIRQYLSHSLVAKEPRLVAMAFTRIIAVQLYAAGTLTNANQTHRAGASKSAVPASA
jgi:hypothetical protein